MAAPRLIKCPTCGRSGDWFAGQYGPFCTHRCKMVDLSKWLGEEHLITGPLKLEHLEQFENLPPGDHLDQPEK